MNIELLSTIPVEYIENTVEVGINQTAFNVSSGSPLGGIYTGPGIIGTSFHPGLAGIGSHEVVYSLTDGNGCLSTDTSVITVYEDAGVFGISESTIHIGPNPFRKDIQVRISIPIELSIYDLKGKLVYHTQILQSKHIDLQKLEPGLYKLFVKQINGEQRRFMKLIKQN